MYEKPVDYSASQSAAILTTLYIKGTRNITILPCITYEGMPENRKKLNFELKNDIGARNYWEDYEYMVEIEEYMKENTERIKRNDSEGRHDTYTDK